MIPEGLEASAAETGEHFGQSGLFPAAAEAGTRGGGGGGGLGTGGGLGSRCFGSAGQGGALPGCGGAAGLLCLAVEAEQVGVAGAFASVHGCFLLLVQFLLEKQGQPAVLLLLSLPAQLVRLRQRRRGAGMETGSFGRHQHSVVQAPSSG